MNAFRRFRPTVVPFVPLFVLSLAACHDLDPTGAAPTDPPAALEARRSGSASDAFTVLTRNVYIGGDIGPVFQADFSNPVAVVQAAAAVWAQIEATRFEDRVVALADEIDRLRPSVVGLQEVFRFVVLNGSFQPLEVRDNLALLQAELDSRGLPYDVVEVQEGTSAALPVSIDFGTGSIDRWVQFTDRIAVLVRDDVELEGSARAQYAAGYTLTPGLTLKRGWVRVDLRHAGVPYHYVNTHLEGQSLAPIQAAQAAELLGSVLAGLDGVTVLSGDLNSDAEAGPGAPSWTPTYDELTDAGFVDAWLQATPRGRRRAGYTCCHDPDLGNAVPTLDERIDFVLIRAAGSRGSWDGRPGAVRAEVVGDERADRTPDGLWPSDHAGLFASLRLPRGLFRDR